MNDTEETRVERVSCSARFADAGAPTFPAKPGAAMETKPPLGGDSPTERTARGRQSQTRAPRAIRLPTKPTAPR